MNMSWYEKARHVIEREHAKMPEDISKADRKKWIQDAYPFGPREYFPYKMWCKAQRQYFERFGIVERKKPPQQPKKPPQQPMNEGLFSERAE